MFTPCFFEILVRATRFRGATFFTAALRCVLFAEAVPRAGATGGEVTVTGAGGAGGADTGGVSGVAMDVGDTGGVVPGCCDPFVAPNRPAMNGFPMHS